MGCFCLNYRVCSSCFFVMMTDVLNDDCFDLIFYVIGVIKLKIVSC